jgi:signal transduction histidine kinase
VQRRVEFEHPDGLALSVCDPARLQQVVSNLLSNADKYSPPESPVAVSVRRVGETVEFTVRDHGAGIPEESREAVFEPFHRLGDHMTRGVPGTGLGLHIARRLVEAMGGLIWVDDASDGGAAFHVTLPALAADHDLAMPVAQAPPPHWDDRLGSHGVASA